MRSSTLMILVSVTTMAVLTGEIFAAMPLQCNSGFLEELPPRLRKICVAIARIWDAREMNDFVDNREYRENLPRYDSSVKRQDVDHVFCASENDVKNNGLLCIRTSDKRSQVLFQLFDHPVIDS